MRWLWPSSEAEMIALFLRTELPAARFRDKLQALREADVGRRVNEIRMLDLDDVRWELGRFGKLNVRHAREHDAAAPSRGWCR
jgi:hypothetical protein